MFIIIGKCTGNPQHFHIRMSNESFDAIVDPENSWPTFFPAGMTGEEICEHMEGHDHDEDEEHKREEGEEHEHEEEKDEHVWLSLKNERSEGCIRLFPISSKRINRKLFL